MSNPQIPKVLAGAVCQDVAGYGLRGVETGMFLLGPRDGSGVTTVAFAGTAGVTRRKDHFAVTGTALARLFRHADDHDLLVMAQVHSHGRAAFLSETDLRYGFAVEGFTTSVIPNYRCPSADPRVWGWWRYTSGCWVVAAPYVVAGSEGEASRITFDEDGIHAS